MKNAKVSILGWLGWYAGGGKGVIEHSESGFLFISVQICLKLTNIPNFIKIRGKTAKLAFWGGWGGWGWLWVVPVVGFSYIVHFASFFLF